MSDDKSKIERHELFDRTVDEALAKERSGREPIGGKAPGREVGIIRRILLEPMFYLPTAALLGALVVIWIIEPRINDIPSVRGEVMLVNSDPFDGEPGMVTLTVGRTAVYVDPKHGDTLPGTNGQPAFKSIDEITVGTRIEAAGIEIEGSSGIMAGQIRPTDEPAGDEQDPEPDERQRTEEPRPLRAEQHRRERDLHDVEQP